MEIKNTTKVKDELKEYPWLLEEAIKMDERLKIAKSPVGKMFINKATVESLCAKAKIDPQEVIEKIQELISTYKDQNS
ncbi:MAG: hypothetical protein IJJ44_01985 [Solobacterium sp.]|nr:hypothetical protein [Solobacterium sp.]